MIGSGRMKTRQLFRPFRRAINCAPPSPRGRKSVFFLPLGGGAVARATAEGIDEIDGALAACMKEGI